MIKPRKMKTRRERLKSALYLGTKNAKFLKLKKGDALGFLKIQFVVKYQKNEGPLETKNFRKSLTRPKKGAGKVS